MVRKSKQLVVLVGVVVLMAALASNSPAQVIVAPAPRITYYSTPAPAVSYYTPSTVYYTPSYYTPSTVYYSAAPVVSYYSAPAVVGTPATTVTYRGILPWRAYSYTTYGGGPVYAAPFRAPFIRYYGPAYVYP